MEQLFSQLVVVGVGLLGGSIGQAARQAAIASGVVGLFRSRASSEKALKCGAVDHAFFEVQDALSHVTQSAQTSQIPMLPQLIVICSPVGIIAQHICDIVSYYKNLPPDSARVRCLITDVGSTKAQIAASLEKESFPPGVAYIGSHPIAGSEKSGVEAARADLFEGKTTVLTDSVAATDEDVALVRRFWERLGSHCLELKANRHDQILARTSHLPHVLSAMLALAVEEKEYELTGTGFADLTRLAGGNPEVWVDILQSNGQAICHAIEEFQTLLSKWKPLLASGDRDQIITLLKEAKKKRDALGS
ncbi:MAG: prephenate dehydrogenase/arogenate dehydrogenase family protein [Thermoguttaceae bacterium]|nr:prephenate dehydrogenase/arogenate dehydrogenase family protein [Thermoguttaceae bacterium]